MIECVNCETGQFLQITQSRVYFPDGDIEEITEDMECTVCGARGGVVIRPDEAEVYGDLRDNGDKPEVSL